MTNNRKNEKRQMLNFQCRQPNRTTMARTLNLALLLGHTVLDSMKETDDVQLFGGLPSMVLKIGRFGKYVQKDLESFEMWCWGRMEKINSALLLKNEVLHAVKEERTIICTIK